MSTTTTDGSIGRATTVAEREWGPATDVWVNGSSRHFRGVPFGGTESSGVGREKGVEELLGYTELTAVVLV